MQINTLFQTFPHSKKKIMPLWFRSCVLDTFLAFRQLFDMYYKVSSEYGILSHKTRSWNELFPVGGIFESPPQLSANIPWLKRPLFLESQPITLPKDTTTKVGLPSRFPAVQPCKEHILDPWTLLTSPYRMVTFLEGYFRYGGVMGYGRVRHFTGFRLHKCELNLYWCSLNLCQC